MYTKLFSGGRRWWQPRSPCWPCWWPPSPPSSSSSSSQSCSWIWSSYLQSHKGADPPWGKSWVPIPLWGRIHLPCIAPGCHHYYDDDDYCDHGCDHHHHQVCDNYYDCPSHPAGEGGEDEEVKSIFCNPIDSGLARTMSDIKCHQKLNRTLATSLSYNLQFQVCNTGNSKEEEAEEENTLEAGGALGLRADISTLCLDSQVFTWSSSWSWILILIIDPESWL